MTAAVTASSAAPRVTRLAIAGGVFLAIAATCVIALFWTLDENSPLFYNAQYALPRFSPPSGERPAMWFGTDQLGRSLLARCLVGGCVSLAVGIASAALSVVLGVGVGMLAGFRGGWIDATLMRLVDILYGLPYILLVILFKIAFERRLSGLLGESAANLVVLFGAIGAVSWLTMARVVRGQVLSLRSQPFIEAAHALGVPERRIFLRHLLPNLVGPIIVYATLTVPQAILQESLLSFLGVGIRPPLPTWGSLASDARLYALSQYSPKVWLILFPCALLAITLLCLNFIGDGLRDRYDPRGGVAKL